MGFRVSRPCGRRGQCSAPDVVGEGNAPLSGAMLPRCSISEVYQRQRCPGGGKLARAPYHLVGAPRMRSLGGCPNTQTRPWFHQNNTRTHTHAHARTHAPAAARARGCHKINPGRSQHLGLPGSARRHGTSVAAPSPSAPPALRRAPEGRALERLRGTASWRPCPAPCPALPW